MRFSAWLKPCPYIIQFDAALTDNNWMLVLVYNAGYAFVYGLLSNRIGDARHFTRHSRAGHDAMANSFCGAISQPEFCI